MRRLSGRRVCRAAEHVYHVESNPPTRPRACATSTARSSTSATTTSPRWSAPAIQKQWVEAAAPVLSYYRGRGLVAERRRARSPPSRWPPRSTRLAPEAWRHGVIVRKSDARGRDDGARRRGGRRDARPARGERQPGVTLRELDGIAEDLIRQPRRRADVQGLPRLPRVDLRVAERDGRARHPRPVRAQSTATCSRSTWA